MTRALLVTGFEPFGGDAVNPAEELLRTLAGATVAGHRIATARLPVTFRDALPALQRELERVQPPLVLGVGQAGGRARLSVERVALNLVDALEESVMRRVTAPSENVAPSGTGLARSEASP